MWHDGAAQDAHYNDAPAVKAGTLGAPIAGMGLQDKIKIYERQQIQDALDKGGSSVRAAELLEMPLRTLRRRMRRYGLSSDVRADSGGGAPEGTAADPTAPPVDGPEVVA